MSEEQSLDLVNAPEPAAETTQNPETPAAAPEATEGNLPEESGAESVESTEPASEAEDKKELPKGVEKRLSKLTKQKYDLLAKNEALEREKQELQEKLRSQPIKTREDFATEAEYLDYQVNSRMEAKLTEQSIDQQSAQIREQQAQINAQSWAVKVEEAKAAIPDFVEVVGQSQAQIPQDVMQMITDSDVGPELAYHFAKNPGQAEGLHFMDNLSKATHLATLQMTLRQQKSAQVTKPVTQATPTPSSNGMGTTPSNPLSDQTSMADWMKARNKQLGR